MIILQIGMALIFSLFWMWWYYRQDVYEKEPVGLLARLFVLSMPLSVLVGLLQWVIDGRGDGLFSNNSNFILTILFYLLVVSVTEEVAKFAVVFTLTRNHKAFNEQVDGIIYAAASALGFATFENIFFMSDQGDFIILLRGPVSALAHILFSAMWGASLGFAKFKDSPTVRRRMIIAGLIRAIIAHAIFDVLIALGSFTKIEWLSLTSVVFIGFMYWLVSLQIGKALQASDYNPDNQVRRLLRQLRRGQNEEPRYVPNPYRQENNNSQDTPDENQIEPTNSISDDKIDNPQPPDTIKINEN